MSGVRVIFFIFAGVLAIALLTLALYFATRKDDGDGPSNPASPSVQVELVAATS
jgi:hypothetical protein